MFGGIEFFVKRNMFAGAHQDSIFLRLSPEDRLRIFDKNPEVAPFEPLPGRVMKEYVVLPDHLCENKKIFSVWVDRSYRFVTSLPGKKGKIKKKN